MGGLGILCCVGDPSVPNPRISSHLARGEGRFPWHEMQACHYPPRGMGGECAPPWGAGAGPLAACPQGFVQPFRPVLPPSLPYPRRQGTSLVLGWVQSVGVGGVDTCR